MVNDAIKDGQRVLEQLALEGFEVTAAFWLHESDNNQWRFYVVSPAYVTDGPQLAYRRLQTAIRQLGVTWIDPLEVKLIGPTNSVAQAVLAILQQSSGVRAWPVRWGGGQLGNQSVEGAYLYPLPAVATT